MKIALSLICGLLFTSVSAHAERLATNIDDVIIKNVQCSMPYLYYVVSNKSSVPLNKIAIITVFDVEGDPVDNGSTFIKLRPVSGGKYKIAITCSDRHSYAFRFE